MFITKMEYSIMRFKKKFLLSSALLPIGFNAAADTLYDSLSASSAGYNLISDANFGPLADSFSTGSSAFLLRDVQLALKVDNPTTTGTVTVSLLSDNYTSPGVSLATLGTINDSALSAYTPATVDFAQATAIDLAANTRYWVEVSATDDSSAGWSYTADTSGVGVVTEYNANSFWVYNNSPSDGPYQLQLNGISVPLPGAIWLFGSALGGFTALRRRASVNILNQA
jgi:hypothetical protein